MQAFRSAIVLQAYIKETSQMLSSYSKKGYSWDSACIESFRSLIE